MPGVIYKWWNDIFVVWNIFIDCNKTHGYAGIARQLLLEGAQRDSRLSLNFRIVIHKKIPMNKYVFFLIIHIHYHAEAARQLHLQGSWSKHNYLSILSKKNYSVWWVTSTKFVHLSLMTLICSWCFTFCCRCALKLTSYLGLHSCSFLGKLQMHRSGMLRDRILRRLMFVFVKYLNSSFRKWYLSLCWQQPVWQIVLHRNVSPTALQCKTEWDDKLIGPAILASRSL